MTVSAELDSRFRDAAASQRLLAIAYDLVESPIGSLLVAASDHGVCRIAFDGESVLDELARRYGPAVLRSPRPLDEARREFEEYFEGRRQAFELTVDLRALPAFQQSVLEELVRVPYGEVATYGGLAGRIGRPRAARAVGGALNRNPVPIVVPCHRVVGAHGQLTGYAGGLERKRALLELEGALAS